MLYLDLVVILFFGKKLWTTIQNLELLAWKLTELCSIYFLLAILFFGGHFVFWRKKAELSLWTTMQNLELLLAAILFFGLNFFIFWKKKSLFFAEGHYECRWNFGLLVWKLTELYPIAPACTSVPVSQSVNDYPKYRAAFTAKNLKLDQTILTAWR